MNTVLQILLFLVCNAIGFFAVSIVYFASLTTGLVTAEALQIDQQAFNLRFAGGVPMVWLVCLAFSFSAFFVKSGFKYMLFIAPAIIPLAYGFSVMLLFSAA